MSELSRKEMTKRLRKALNDLSRTESNIDIVNRYASSLGLDDLDFDKYGDGVVYELDEAVFAMQELIDPDVGCVEPISDASYWVFSVHPDDDYSNRSFRATMVCSDHLDEAIQWAKRSMEPTIYVWQHGELIREEKNDWEP